MSDLQQNTNLVSTKRKREIGDLSEGGSVAKRPRPTHPTSAIAGFDSDNSFCTVCKTVKPIDEFFFSYVQRNVYYCKPCCAIKQKTQRKRELTPAGSIDPQRRAALMLKSLRRLCTRPWPAVDVSDSVAPLNLSLAAEFDARVTLQVLDFWHDTSALSLSSIPEQVGPANTVALQLVPWYKVSSLPLQPWEVIPVTRVQARRLADIPYSLWDACLKSELSADVNARLRTFEEFRKHTTNPPVPDTLAKIGITPIPSLL